MRATPEPDGGPPRSALLLLLIAALLHGLAYHALLAPWMGEDEPWQLEFAHHTAAGHPPWGGISMRGPSADRLDDRHLLTLSQLNIRQRLGGVAPEEIRETQREIVDSMREHAFFERVPFAGWGPGCEGFEQIAAGFTATHQPAPYFGLAGLWLRALGVQGVEAQVRALRLFSLLCYLAVVALAWALARQIFDDPWSPLAAALFVAWLPMHARQAAVVNNDVLAKVLSSGALLLGARALRDRGKALGAALLLGCVALGMWVKPTTASTLAILAWVAAWKLRGRASGLGRAGLGLGIGALLSGLAFLIWFAGRSHVVPKRLSNLWHRLDQASGLELWEKLLHTFSGTTNWESRLLPEGFYLATWAGLGLLLVAAALASLRSTGERRRLLFLCWTLVAVQLALIAFRGEARGRYFFPVLPALGALVAAGLFGLVPPRWKPRAVAGLALAMAAWDAFYLWRGIALEEYGRWGS